MRCIGPITLTFVLGACSSPAIRCDDHLSAINARLPPRPADSVPAPGAPAPLSAPPAPAPSQAPVGAAP